MYVNVALAQGESAPNGCGTGWNRYLVPNSIPILQCEFKEACNTHDTCYARCEKSLDGDCEYRRCRPGGDLAGNAICWTDERYLSLANKARQRRNTCDANFHSDLLKLNAGRYVCHAFAVIYRDAVKIWGDGPFIGIDPAPNLTQQREDYEKAIRDFFIGGTEPQFRRIVEEDKTGRQTVDMKRNIRFTPDKGLENSN